jgi:hypothetical protein
MLFLIALLFAAAGLILLWPRWFATVSFTLTLSTLAGIVLLGMFAAIALTLLLGPDASAGGRP